MSLDEDFTVLVKDPQLETLEQITKEAVAVQKQHERLVCEQNEVCKLRDQQRQLAQQFKQRSAMLRISLEQEGREQLCRRDAKQERRELLLEEQVQLQEAIQAVEVSLSALQVESAHLKQQTDISSAVPERRVVFTGLTEDIADAQQFDVKPRIVYPMDEGTALITFEDQAVAQNVLALKDHMVCLGGDCRITVKAKPVHLMVPSFVEMETQVCPRRVLVSNLPKMDSDRILDKLEIHFSKRQNGGGEVEECCRLSDSGNVVITFTENNVTPGLTHNLFHAVSFGKGSRHRVKVTPFLNGTITNLQTELVVCARTLLLTGICDVMDPETLQDLLEIHFQKAMNGGGEVETILYNPPGERTSAVFEKEQPAEDGPASA